MRLASRTVFSGSDSVSLDLKSPFSIETDVRQGRSESSATDCLLYGRGTIV
jgi:hypothetical protein